MEKKCGKCKKLKKSDKAADSSDETNSGKSKTDPFGSYTGVPENRYEQPVQDADDL